MMKEDAILKIDYIDKLVALSDELEAIAFIVGDLSYQYYKKDIENVTFFLSEEIHKRANEHEKIMANCDTMIYLGGNGPGTQKELSELMGKATIDKRTNGETLGKQGNSTRNYDVLGRDMPYLLMKSSVALNFT